MSQTPKPPEDTPATIQGVSWWLVTRTREEFDAYQAKRQPQLESAVGRPNKGVEQ